MAFTDREQERIYKRDYYQRNREKIRAQQRAYRDANVEAVRAYNRTYRENHPDYMREWRQRNRESVRVYDREYRQRTGSGMRYRHGLRPEEWAALWDAQGGKCYLGGEELASCRSVAVDHDHACCGTGRSCATCRRGLACGDCNTAIGLFREDTARMRRAADALDAAQAQVESRRANERDQLSLFEPGKIDNV